MAPPPLVELRRVAKSFGPTRALCGVDFDVRAGEVHALSGANGAGKSTLIRIIAGVHRDFEGTLLVGGSPRRLTGPEDARRAGIATIHQELSLIEPMSVADNLWLGRGAGGLFGATSKRKRCAEAARLLAEVGLGELDPTERVAALPLPVKQLLEIAKVLGRDARVIVMDEPTSALGEREVDALFARIEKLRARGRGIVFISHRLEEVFRLADRITVLRDGARIRTARADALSRDELVADIAGRQLNEGLQGETVSAARHDEPMLKIESLEVPDADRRRLQVREARLCVARGEVLGLAGLQGSGTSALLHGLFGSFGSAARGQVRLGGKPFVIRSPARSIEQGMVLLAADRAASVIGPLSVTHNATLSSLARWCRAGWVQRSREAEAVARLSERVRLVAASPDAPAATLSGGNQQKVALSRCLLARPKVLLLDEPTRGIDIGAKADVYALVRELARAGVAVVLAASEVDELTALCDRIAVMFQGRIVARLERSDFSRERILRAAMGAVGQAA